MRALLQVHAFDRTRDLPDWFQEDVATAIRAKLRVPQPLGISAYETDWEHPARTAHPALRAALRAVVTRDGHIRDARVTGGVRNDAMDGALLAAMQMVDSSGALKVSASEGLQENEMPIVISLTTSVPPNAQSADSLLSFPLFAFRTPLLAVTRTPQPLAGVGIMRYPDALRARGEEGSVAVAVVVGADGLAEDGTVVALRPARREFMQSVLDALPTFRFRPLEVEGCAVRSLEQMPFTFRLGK